jgi:carbonic anhydrase
MASPCGFSQTNRQFPAALNDLIRQNVIAQLANVATHPPVALGFANGRLTLHGWVYDIETGSIEALDGDIGEFVSLAECPDARARIGRRKPSCLEMQRQSEC